MFLYSFALNNAIPVIRAKKEYKNNPNKYTLLDLCNTLHPTTRYDDIIDFFPMLLALENLDDITKNNDVCKKYYQKNWSSDEIKSMYVVTYLYAQLDVNGEEKFKQEFDKYCHFFKYEIHDNEMPMLSAFLVHVYRNPRLAIPLYNTKNSEIFLNHFHSHLNNIQISKSQKDFCNIFIKETLMLVNSYNTDRLLEISDTYKEPVYRGVIPGRDSVSELSNEYVIVDSYIDNERYLGKISYLDNVVVIVNCNITQCFYNDRYLCVEQTTDKVYYYIIDTQYDVIEGPMESTEFNDKMNHLNISDLSEWKE